jgi:hypothetical protein
MNACPVRRIISPSIPYITISIGLLVFHSAWLAILSYHTGMVVILLLSRTGVDIRRSYKSNNFCFPLISALVGAGSGILLFTLWPLFAIPDDINSYIQNIGLNKGSWPVFLGYFVLVNPWLEEYYWRGYLATDTKGITPNDLLFSGYHLIVLAGYIETIWLIVVFVCLTVGAWFWRQMNRLNGGLLASTVSHMAADITVIFTIYYISLQLT